MAATVPDDVIRAHVPPASEHVATIRSFVGAVGRHFGCEDETIEDMRLAVTEVCAQALEEGIATEGFELRAWLGDPFLVLEIEPAARFADPVAPREPLDPASGGSRRALLGALFEGMEVIERDGAKVLRIPVPLPQRD